MDRGDDHALDPFYEYYGHRRRPARRSAPPTAPESPSDPTPMDIEEDPTEGEPTETDPMEDIPDSYEAQINEPEYESVSEPVEPWSPDHVETDPVDSSYYFRTYSGSGPAFYSESEPSLYPTSRFSDQEAPSYHPTSRHSEPESLDQSLHALVVEYPPEPGSPSYSTHSSVGDNFDYPEIQLLDDEEAEPDDFHYVLNDNEMLVRLLEHYFVEAINITETLQGRYLVFLTLIMNHPTGHDQHSPVDWVRTILYFFPCTRFWARFINELLDDEPVRGVSIHLRYLKSIVRLYM